MTPGRRNALKGPLALSLLILLIAPFTPIASYAIASSSTEEYCLEVDKPPEPRQFQQGDDVVIRAIVSKGKPYSKYNLNVTVTDPFNVTHRSAVIVSTDERGLGESSIVYPKDFLSPAGYVAHTGYVGVYKAALNLTLSITSFSVGLTNATKYHRYEVVHVRAINYAPNESVTIAIESVDKAILTSVINASSDGVVDFHWMIPGDASIGEYVVSVNGSKTMKPVKDVQPFLIPGFPISVKTVNLGEEPVSFATVRAYHFYNETKRLVEEEEADEGGLALFRLEVGRYEFEVLRKGKLVGRSSLNVVKDGVRDVEVTCDLSNVKVFVMDWKGESPIPFVRVELKASYLAEGVERVDVIVGESNVDGVAILRNAFVNMSYALMASRYGKAFLNRTMDIPMQGWVDVTIFVPKRSLHTLIVDSKGAPASGLIIEAYEVSLGMAKAVDVRESIDGTASFELDFGRYLLRVREKDVLLDETAIDLTIEGESLNVTIRCFIYNLDIFVKVVDLLGSPIPRLRVKLTKEGTAYQREGLTDENGVVLFSNVIGGDLKAFVYVKDEEPPAFVQSFYVDRPMALTLKVSRYVMAFGALTEALSLATLVTLAIIASLATALLMKMGWLKWPLGKSLRS